MLFLILDSSSGSNKIKHLENALELLVESKDILKLVAERDTKPDEKTDLPQNKNKKENEEPEDKTEIENELNLLIIFEQRLQFILLTLVKLCLGKKE